MKVWAKALIIATAVVLALPGSALAHEQSVLDRADTAGPLDIAAARSVHKRSAETQRKYFDLELLTYDAWGDDAVAGGRNFVTFEFNWDRDANIERCLIVQQREVEPGTFALEATVYRDCTYLADERITSTLLITRPDEHAVKVQVSRRALVGKRSTYRWRAVTSYEERPSNGACAAPEPHEDGDYGTCADFTRWVEHAS